MGVAWNLSTCVIRASGAGVLQVVPSRPSPSSTSTEVLGVGLAGRHVTLVLVLIMWSTMSCNCYYRLIFAENRWCGDIWRAHGTPTPPRPARGPAPHSVLCLPLLQARSLLITFTTCSSYTWCWCWYDILCDSSFYLRLNYFICAVSVKSLLCEFYVHDRYFTCFMLENDQAYRVSKMLGK